MSPEGPLARVVLDVPGPVAYRRKGENPPDELEEERRVYRALSGVDVVDASAEQLPPALADHYLALKARGLL